MREVYLENGITVKLGVTHTDDEDITLRGVLIVGLRGTRVRATFVSPTGHETEVNVRTVCSPNDNFCKQEGRRMVASKLLKEMCGFSKDDRARVFYAICPEFNCSN